MLADGNSSSPIIPSSPYSMTDWSMDDLTQLDRQGFRHCTDPNKPENSIDTIFSSVVQPNPNALNTFDFSSSFSPAANHGGVGLSQATLNKLDDRFATTLNGSVGPVTGDAVWAFQWDVLIDPDSSFSIDINKSVYVTPVPEPTGIALFSLAVILLGIARRRCTFKK
jgi:hypothetical protein